MKIISRVGERLLPRWIKDELAPLLAFAGAGSALWAGSVKLVELGWERLGERLDKWERVGALVLAVYVAVYECWYYPHAASFAVPGAVILWCAAAWWIAPPILDAPTPQHQAMAARDGFILWLTDLMEDRPGIHLRDLYPAMRTLPGHETRDNTQLRAALNTLGIPVRRSLRLGGVAGRSGVALADLQPLPSPAGEPSGELDGDAGQPADSPLGEPVGEGLESA